MECISNPTSQSHRMGVKTHLDAMSHIPMYRMQAELHHMNTVIETHTIHFLHRSRKQKNCTVRTNPLPPETSSVRSAIFLLHFY